MSHRATTWAFQVRGLKPATRVVLLYLADRHNPDQGCFPSQARLAADCELSRSALNEHLATLESLGLICREQRRGEGNRQLSTSYKFAFEDDFRPAETAESRVQNPDTEPEKPCPENADFRVRISGDSVSGLPDSEPVREPVREPLSAPAREELPAGGERGEDRDRQENRQAVEAQFWKLVRDWPQMRGMPKERAMSAFVALTPEERVLALDRRDAWIQALKAQRKDHVPAPSTYLGEKLFLEVEPVVAKPDVVEFAPYGHGWMAWRMKLLSTLKPHEWRPTPMQQRLIDQGKGDILDEHRRKGRYPLVHALDADAERGLSVRVRMEAGPPPRAEFESYARIRRGSPQWDAWEAWHQQQDWPWIKPPAQIEWIFVPTEWPQKSATEAAE